MTTNTETPGTVRHRRTGMRVVALVLAFLLVAAGCGGDDDDGVSTTGPSSSSDTGDDDTTQGTGGSSATGDPFGETEWVLTGATVDGTDLQLLASHPITIRRNGNEVNGTAACNGYFGTIIDSDVLFEGFGQTEMACDPPESMQLESSYLAALGRVTTAISTASTLTLSGPGVEMTFDMVAPTADAELIGTNWVLDSIISGDAASSTVAGSSATLLLEANALSGSDGCNSFNGGYEIDGDTLRPGALASTTRGCLGDISNQADAVGAVLFSQPAISIEGDRLTLTGANNTALVYRVG